MNERIIELAKKAGFVLWGNDPHKPEGAIIDWASNYDKEFEKFAKLLAQECVKICEAEAKKNDAMVDSDLTTETGKLLYDGMWGGAKNCAAAIKESLLK